MSASLFGTGGIVNVNVNGSLVPQSFVGIGGQTLFNITAFTYTVGTNSLLVFINGQRQILGRDFGETSTTSFTLVEGVVAGDFVDIIGFPQTTLTAVNSGVVGYLLAAAGAVASTVTAKFLERISVKDFGALGDGVADDTVAITAARAFMLINAVRYKLIWPAGIYLYSASPNWAIQNFVMEAEGEVRLRYTGTGNAVIYDAGAGAQLIYNCYMMGNFIIEARSTAQNVLYVRSCHHSEFHFNARGAGGLFAGLRVEFAVCSKFYQTTSVNEEGWYTGAKPKYGMWLTKRNALEDCSYCQFFNPVIEGVDTGINLEFALGNVFYGGTSEGCTAIGVNINSVARCNKFYGMDFEANTTQDIYIQGFENEFYGCDSLSQTTLDALAKGNKFFGGSYQNITCIAGSTKNYFAVTYNRQSAGGAVVDGGTFNSFVNSQNPLSASLGKIPIKTALVVGASPYTFTNTSGDNVDVIIAGGTITNLTYGRGVTGDTISYVTGNKYTLRPGDALIVTYTVLPTMLLYA